MKKIVKKKTSSVKSSVRKARPTDLTRGVSKVVLLAIIAVILSAGGGMYLYSRNTGFSPLASIVKAPLNPNCIYKDADFCKFMNKFPTVKRYTMTSSTNISGSSYESVYEIDGDGRFHSLTKQNSKELSNSISIDNTFYTFDYADNKWWKQTVTPAEVDSTIKKEKDDTFSFDETEDKTKYTFVTKETCGSLTCFKYEMVSPDDASTKQFIWFDDREYLARKISVEDGTNGSTEMTYSYDTKAIVPPSPTKEGTPGVSSTDMSPDEANKMMQQYQNNTPTTSDDSYAPSDDSSDEY